MRLAVLCFAIGVWVCQLQPELPALSALAGVAAAAAAMLLALDLRRRRLAAASRLAVPVVATAACALGFVWAAGCAHLRLADALREGNEGSDIVVTGVVASLPQVLDNGTRFEFDVEQAQAEVPRHISLAWYRGWREAEWHRYQEVHAGERWQLTVRLKRPHGNLNPFGFDFEAWLLERGIRATGYVRTTQLTQPNRRLDEFVSRPSLLVERLRERIRQRFFDALPEHEYAGILVALVVGDQRSIDASQWQLFNRTGVTHLMSISGLHVTMIAGLAYWIALRLWRRIPVLVLRLPAQKAAAVAGWFAAFAYCLLAGFGVPAQRTLYMLSVVAVALWLDRAHGATHVLLLALLVVLLLDPWAVLAAGFWLSFAAVALLFYAGAGRVGGGHWLAQWGRAQWAVTLGLLPALLALFQQFSLVSPVANAVAIPVVSSLITPLALIAAVIPYDPLLHLAHALSAALMMLMEWLASLPVAVWQQHAPPWWAVGVGLLGCLMLLLPSGIPARWVGAFLLLPLVLVPPKRPDTGELWVSVLDVGQGLAVHVQTRSHDLLYDAGPQYSLEANSGNRIIVPYLRAAGVHRLEGMVITHQDTDHSGGAVSVMDAVPLGWLASSLAEGNALRARGEPQVRCQAGQQWSWDGIRFEVLHPPRAAYESPPRKPNDMSCVIRASNGEHAILLTSDIEARSEEELLRANAEILRADVLVVPHHGSRSSSTPQFVTAVGARKVIFPVGYRSRFQHPHPEVLGQYERSGARIYRTDRDGALIVVLGRGSVSIRTERETRRRYWHGR
jgi:competence protein ComEC